MQKVNLITDIEGVWRNIDPIAVERSRRDPDLILTPDGCGVGLPSVQLRIWLPDGKIALAEVSLTDISEVVKSAVAHSLEAK